MSPLACFGCTVAALIVAALLIGLSYDVRRHVRAYRERRLRAKARAMNEVEREELEQKVKQTLGPQPPAKPAAPSVPRLVAPHEAVALEKWVNLPAAPNPKQRA